MESCATTGAETELSPRRHRASISSCASIPEILQSLGTSPDGLTSDEAAARLVRTGPNSVRTHRVSALAVLLRQLNNEYNSTMSTTGTRPR
ncbi:cation-transporting P-type ATPase [Mycolicibacterium mengxianglii]|uniref:cation-transporting P-type ATPase n=1 Tax=Mycolicibacterium mengxianglii TaxID=2736649 RepID=UPI002FC6550D